MSNFSRSSLLKWLFVGLCGVLLLFSSVLYLAYSKQDKLVAELLSVANEGFDGKIVVEGSHISPFRHFTYVSIDLEGLQIFEGKADTSAMILRLDDTYLGFDFWSVISGEFTARSLELNGGFLKLVQHVDGSFNIANAFASGTEEGEEVKGADLHLDLQEIRLVDVDLLKLNEATNVLFEAFVQEADASFKLSSAGKDVSLNTKFLFNFIIEGDTTLFRNKPVEIEAGVSLDSKSNLLMIEPSTVLVEKAQFDMEGTVDIDDNMNLDLDFKGAKPSFDLFLAFAPKELAPVLGTYDNGGLIYFNASVEGQSINGENPQIEVNFGASEAYIHNKIEQKEVNDLNFKGFFTNGAKRDLSTMSITIQDFSAIPDTGEFEGEVTISNFESPEIDIRMLSRFDLAFLANFLNIEDLQNLAGALTLELNFHDIIDLKNPEKSLEQLNESYYTRLTLEDVSFSSPSYHLPISNLNVDAIIDGKQASIKQFDFRLGSSDLSIKTDISDLPAIVHHTDIPIDVKLDIQSNLIDLTTLTYNSEDSVSLIDEQIKDLAMAFRFNSSAKALTESPVLPMGTFFIESLNASFQNYPHRLHDFVADVLIDSSAFQVRDFKGMIDDSDFHFTGRLENYPIWFVENPVGVTSIDFDFDANLIKLEDLFAYGGENYVPEDYRHEEFSDLKLHGVADLTFDEKLIHSELKVDNLAATMKIHPMRFMDFGGTFSIDSSEFTVEDFGGQLGNTSFSSDLVFFLNPDSTQFHTFSLEANQLDFDQLFAYNPPPENETNTQVDHEGGFNIFILPFPNLAFDFSVDKLNYHRYLLDDFAMSGRVQTNHFAYLDTLYFKSADGQIQMNGYFNGENPDAIYFSPYMELENIDLDKLLFKFDNFGQDQLVSENLHGKLSGNVQGKIHMHPDMIPIIDDSEMEIHFNVIEGSLDDFTPFEALSDFFTDKNLKKVRFDTLRNDLFLTNGALRIPSMNINSTLGYMEISGTQNMDLDMEYFMRIPFKVVTRAAFQKLFAGKNKNTDNQVDEIQYRDETKKTRFINVKVSGTPDDYDIALGKKDEEE